MIEVKDSLVLDLRVVCLLSLLLSHVLDSAFESHKAASFTYVLRRRGKKEQASVRTSDDRYYRDRETWSKQGRNISRQRFQWYETEGQTSATEFSDEPSLKEASASPRKADTS